MIAKSIISRLVRRLRSHPLVTCLLVGLTVLSVIWFSLREYRSTATMEVRLDYGCNPSPHWPGSDEYFIASTGQMLRSLEVLAPAIDRFNLTATLSADGTPWLAQFVEVRGVPYTNLLEVSVYLRNPQLASDVANAIVQSFNEYRVKELGRSMKRAFAQLESEIELRKTRVEKARDEMTELKERGEIVDADPEKVVATIKTGTNQTSINSYTAAKARFLNQKKILEAGELKLQADKADPVNFNFEPVKMWQRADPSQHRAHIDLRRIWARHRLLCIFGLITGVALVGWGIVTAFVGAAKLQSQVSAQLHGKDNRGLDTTTYDY
jgi:hypothetical protein